MSVITGSVYKQLLYYRDISLLGHNDDFFFDLYNKQMVIPNAIIDIA